MSTPPAAEEKDGLDLMARVDLHIEAVNSCKLKGEANSGKPSALTYDSSEAIHLWSDEELETLELGLRRYPAEQHSNMTIYAKIASMIPGKTVRDVAAYIRHALETKRVATKGQPRQASAAAMAPGAAAGCVAARHASAIALVAAGMRGGPTHPDPKAAGTQLDSRVSGLLQENMSLLSNLRDNLLHGQLEQNYELMRRFSSNVANVMALLSTLPSLMPPLPVQPNTFLLQGHDPQGSRQAQSQAQVGQQSGARASDRDVNHGQASHQEQGAAAATYGR
ncbi:unnamed protein product [Chrysoparadoxa australica]